jgi:hypothetical protein
MCCGILLSAYKKVSEWIPVIMFSFSSGKLSLIGLFIEFLLCQTLYCCSRITRFFKLTGYLQPILTNTNNVIRSLKLKIGRGCCDVCIASTVWLIYSVEFTNWNFVWIPNQYQYLKLKRQRSDRLLLFMANMLLYLKILYCIISCFLFFVFFIFHKWNISTEIQWIANIKYRIISEIFIWQEFIMLYIVFYYWWRMCYCHHNPY